MRMLSGRYNEQVNAVDIVNHENGYFLRLDCGKWETGLRTTPWSQCKLDALALDEPLEYARLMLSGEIQDWLDAIDDDSVW